MRPTDRLTDRQIFREEGRTRNRQIDYKVGLIFLLLPWWDPHYLNQEAKSSTDRLTDRHTSYIQLDETKCWVRVFSPHWFIIET